MQILIVDGHSMIFAWDDLRRLHDRRTAFARDQLVRRLTQYQDWTGSRLVVVFDGKGAKTSSERPPGGIQISYSGSGQTADDVIERMVAGYAGSYDICVATGDRMEQLTVSAFGATWITPADLKARIDETEKDATRTIQKHNRQAPDHARRKRKTSHPL